MDTPDKAPRRKPHPKKLKNLRPHPETLSPGRAPLAPSPQEIEFCRYRALGFAIVDAGRFSGFDKKKSYSLMHSRKILVEVEAQREKLRQEAESKVDTTVADLRKFAVADAKHIARTLKSEPQKVKHNRNIMEAAGMVQAEGGRVQVNTQTTANAAAVSGGTFRERFKSMWLIAKEAEMLESFEHKDAPKQIPDGSPNPTPA